MLQNLSLNGFSSHIFGVGVQGSCVGKFVALIFTFFYTIWGGAQLDFSSLEHGFDSISFQTEKSFCHCMKHAVFVTCPSPQHAYPPFISQDLTRSVENEIHNCREWSVSLASQHVIGQQLLASFCLCDIFIHP